MDRMMMKIPKIAKMKERRRWKTQFRKRNELCCAPKGKSWYMKKRHEKRVAAQKLAIKYQRDCDVCALKYAITHRWPAAKDVTCFPFMNPMALEGRSTKMMGLQMMNDPSFELSYGEVPQAEVNVEVYSDLLAEAIKDIKKGEEVFMSYKLEERKRKAQGDNNDGDRKKKARRESDEKSNGKRLSI
eukprot:scaffold3791_cov134-Amphora_coffeaeformis.AAC.1